MNTREKHRLCERARVKYSSIPPGKLTAYNLNILRAAGIKTSGRVDGKKWYLTGAEMTAKVAGLKVSPNVSLGAQSKRRAAVKVAQNGGVAKRTAKAKTASDLAQREKDNKKRNESPSGPATVKISSTLTQPGGVLREDGWGGGAGAAAHCAQHRAGATDQDDGLELEVQGGEGRR